MSVLDILRVEREIVLQHASKTIIVPPSGRLAVRLQPPTDRSRLTAIVAEYLAIGALSEDAQCQLLVDCCDTVLERDPATGAVTEPGGGPQRFDASDERWGEDVETARDCVRKLYQLDEQPIALAGQIVEVVDWLQGIDAAIAARVEGKSGSSPRP